MPTWGTAGTSHALPPPSLGKGVSHAAGTSAVRTKARARAAHHPGTREPAGREVRCAKQGVVSGMPARASPEKQSHMARTTDPAQRAVARRTGVSFRGNPAQAAKASPIPSVRPASFSPLPVPHGAPHTRARPSTRKRLLSPHRASWGPEPMPSTSSGCSPGGHQAPKWL